MSRIRQTVWVALFLAIAPVAFAANEVRFVSPRNRAIALGPTQIELEVTPPPGAVVERVTIVVDGEPLAELLAAPWVAMWDAGDAEKRTKLEARAYFSDGTESLAVIYTSRRRLNQIEKVDLVNLYVIARGSDGGYVTDLTQQEFTLLEDDVPQRIDRFSAELQPLTVGVVLDTSLSMKKGGRLGTAQRAAVEFLKALDPNDQAVLVTFNDEVRVVESLTNDREALEQGIRSTSPLGGTALYDAIWRTAKELNRVPGRKVMILLTDGKDEARSGLEPGSLHTLDEALTQALRSDVMIFAIGLGKELGSMRDFYGRELLVEILFRMAERTGGRLLLPERATQLKKAFRSVSDDLRHQYSLAYESSNARRDGKWREIELETSRPGVEIITRKGYYAPVEFTQPDAPVEPR